MMSIVHSLIRNDARGQSAGSDGGLRLHREPGAGSITALAWVWLGRHDRCAARVMEAGLGGARLVLGRALKPDQLVRLRLDAPTGSVKAAVTEIEPIGPGSYSVKLAYLSIESD